MLCFICAPQMSQVVPVIPRVILNSQKLDLSMFSPSAEAVGLQPRF